MGVGEEMRARAWRPQRSFGTISPGFLSAGEGKKGKKERRKEEGRGEEGREKERGEFFTYTCVSVCVYLCVWGNHMCMSLFMGESHVHMCMREIACACMCVYVCVCMNEALSLV